MDIHKVIFETANANHNNTLDAALMLTNAGAVFFPCGPDKKPRIREWQKLAVVTGEQARAWYAQWPDMTLALPAGPNGLLVIDLDNGKKPGEPDGLDEFKALCARHDYDFMADTLCAKTGSGGLHVFYRMPDSHELRNTAKKLGRAIDTRGHGGYVIIAPSKSERGKYEWLAKNPVAKLPDWLLAMLATDKPRQEAGPLRTPVLTASAYVNERERKAYQAALEGECSKVACAAEGVRNDTLNAASYNLGRYAGAGKLDAGEAYAALCAAAHKCGLAPGEADKTITSGLTSGQQNPKLIEPHGGSWEHSDRDRTEGQGEPARARENQQDGRGEPVQEGKPITLDKYLTMTNARRLIDEFLDAAKEFATSSAIPTGFASLDALLDGGLYPGLYTIGAISSLGKTTFALQIADAIAGAGHDVLIFSLEMSRHELIAKTLSRISRQEAERPDWPGEKARPARYYLSGGWWADSATDEEVQDVYQALDLYAQWAERIYIVEGDGLLDARLVAAKTQQHVRLTDNKPVVIVDYLQILAPMNDRYTDKQNTDRSVVALKRLSRDLKLPVVAVSSFNRENYDTNATLKAFKESGAIEYTSDVVIGLQLKGMGEKNFNAEEAKNANPREIEMLLLKNRHGPLGEAQFKYYPKFNLFMDVYGRK